MSDALTPSHINIMMIHKFHKLSRQLQDNPGPDLKRMSETWAEAKDFLLEICPHVDRFVAEDALERAADELSGLKEHASSSSEDDVEDPDHTQDSSSSCSSSSDSDRSKKIKRLRPVKALRTPPVDILQNIAVIKDPIEVFIYCKLLILNREELKNRNQPLGFMPHAEVSSLMRYVVDAFGTITYRPEDEQQADLLGVIKLSGNNKYDKTRCIYPYTIIDGKRKMLMIRDFMPVTLYDAWVSTGGQLVSLITNQQRENFIPQYIRFPGWEMQHLRAYNNVANTGQTLYSFQKRYARRV